MSITNVITKITVDMAGDVKRFAVKAKQYDRATRVIVVSLLWDEVPYVLDSADTVRCNVHKPDGTIAIIEGDNITVSGNTVTITLPGTALTAAGRAWADIEIETQDESQQVSCQCFEIDIAKSPVDDDSIISTNEFSAMKLATKAANEAAAAARAEIEATAAAGTAASQAAAAAQAATDAANQAAEAATASIQIDTTLTDNSKAAPAGMVGQIKEDLSAKTDFLDALQYTIGSDISTGYETGYYIREADGGKGSLSNFAILTAPAVGGAWYLINPYIKWSQNGNLFAFYDANGNFIKVNNSRPYSSEKYIIVDDDNRLYLVLAPENAAILRVNVYATDAASAEIKNTIVTKRIIENLEVAYRNLNGTIKSLIDKTGENDAGRALAMSVTLSSDITTERKTGYYIGKNGAETANSNFAIMSAPVTPYTWIHFRIYDKWNRGSTILAFYDAAGKVINPEIVADESNFITLSLSEGVYMAHVPKEAVMFKTTVYADTSSNIGAHLSESTINVVTPSKYVLMGGLIREENLGKELRARLDAYDSAIILPTDIINKPFDFTGKSLVIFGDSISYGYGVSTTESWTYKFANKFGMTRSNLSQSRTTIASGIYTRITSYTGSPDYIFIAGGTNDYNQGVTVGEYGDEYADGTFYGALDGICQYLQTNCPNSQIFFFTPIPYLNVTGKEVAGMDEYRRAIFKVATKYGYNVVRCDNIGFPEKVSTYSTMLYKDKIHPTATGHDLMYRAISGKLC